MTGCGLQKRRSRQKVPRVSAKHRGEIHPRKIRNLVSARDSVRFNFSSGRALDACSLDGTGVIRVRNEGPKMLLRLSCVVAVCLALAPSAEAAGHSGLVHRASCSVVRFYVARFSASAAEMWARSHGATEAEIEAARQCLKTAPAEHTQAAHWAAW
jgi:hypothetical protein